MPRICSAHWWRPAMPSRSTAGAMRPAPSWREPRRPQLEDIIALREQVRPLLEPAGREPANAPIWRCWSAAKVWYIDKIASPLPLKVDHPIGSLAPLHCTALGKAFLAFGDARRRRRTLERFTANTIVDAAALEAEIAATRQRGYAIDDEEFSAGIRCVAAPVYDGDGRMVAAVGVSGPTARINAARLDELGRLLRVQHRRQQPTRSRALNG